MRHMFTVGAAACALMITAAFGAANADSFVRVPGTSFVVPVEYQGEPKEGSDSQNFWTDDGLFDNSDDPSASQQQAPSGGDDEIRALQQEFPETDWPSKRK